MFFYTLKIHEFKMIRAREKIFFHMSENTTHEKTTMAKGITSSSSNSLPADFYLPIAAGVAARVSMNLIPTVLGSRGQRY